MLGVGGKVLDRTLERVQKMQRMMMMMMMMMMMGVGQQTKVRKGVGNC